MPYFSRSGSLTSFPEVAREVGLDPWALLQEFGLPRRCLDEPDSMVPSESVCRLLEAAAGRSGLEAFGVRMAEARKLSSLGPLGMFAREQPTLRDAVTALAHYARLINESLSISIEESADVAVLREELLVGDVVPVRQATELAVALLFTSPASTSACVIVCVPVQVVFWPGASVVTGHTAAASSWASFTTRPVIVTLPVFVTRNV